MAWDNTYRPRQPDGSHRGVHFYPDSTSAAAAPPRPTRASHSDAGPTTLPRHPGTAHTRTDDYELPPYVPPTRTAPEVDRMTTDFNSLAAGRGSESSPQITTPLTPNMDSASNSAAPSSGPLGSTATTTATKEAETAFYRNSRFTRRTYPDGALPPSLVIKTLPLDAFDGDFRSYPEFRDNFLELIESQPHLSSQQKLQHLLNHLKGAPLQMAKGFGLSEGSYCEVIELLEARYGDETVLQNLLLQDLVALDSPAARPSDLAAFHRDALQIYQRLKRAGMDMDGNPVCNQLVLGKLPHTIKLKVMEKADEKGRIPTSVQLKEILAHVSSLQRLQTAGLTFTAPSSKGNNHSRSRPNSRQASPSPAHGNGANYRPNYNTGTYVADTENTYVISKQQRRQLCAFCGEPHWSAKCTVYPTVTKRVRRLELLKQCFFCLGGGHWSRACPHRSKELCKVCQKAHHHVALCRTYTGESRPGTPRPTPAKSPKPGGGFGSVTDGVPTAQPSTSGGDSIASPGGGATRSPGGGSSNPRSTPTNTVIGKKEAAGASPANNVRPPSAQNSREAGHGNSKNNRKQQRRNNNNFNKKGANSKQGGTPCSAAAASDESTRQKSGEACSDTGLLPGHQALLQTGRCSNASEDAQNVHEDGRGTEDFFIPAVARQLFLRDDEEISLPESTGHCSNPDPEEFEGVDDQYWHPTDDGFAVSASTSADTQAVLLECIKVIAVNPINGASREAIAFFDSGSSATFASTDLARDLDLPRHEATTMLVNVFGGKKPNIVDGFSTSLVLRSPEGREVHLNAVASDHGVKSVRTALVHRDDLPPLQRNAGALISTRERPDILIGQDAAQRFQRRPGQDLPNGFYVVHTVLGPLVGGAGRVTTEESKDVNVVTTPEGTDDHNQPPQMIVVDIMDRSNPIPDRPKSSVPSNRNNTTANPTHSVGNATSEPPSSTYFVEELSRTPPEETISGYLSGLCDKSDAELLGDFSYLENAGMGTYEMKPDDQAAADMLITMHTREPDGRFNVPLLFRTANGEPPSNEELPTNIALARGRAISTRNSLAKDPKRLADYHEIVLNYEMLNFISKAPRTTPFTKHYLSHHPVFKETSTTTATRPVFDASAKLPGRTCLNDWVFRGPVLLPTVPAILLRSRFPTIIIVSDIGKAFLQMTVKESQRDCLRWFWFKDPFAEPTDDNLVEYRFNRVPFGLKSSPYLLAGVIKMHLEDEGTPLALEMLQNCYVDNVLLMADTVDEALEKYRDSKAIFAKIQMTLREYASNSSAFNNAIEQGDRADLGKLRELGIRWDVTADYWDIPLRPKPPANPTHSVGRDDPPSALAVSEVPATTTRKTGPAPSKKPKRKRSKKTDDNRLTKRTMLRFVAQIFDPMGLVQAILLLAKLVIQEVWKVENDWDDEVSEELAKLWYEAIKDFDQTTIRIPRRLAIRKITSVEAHVFTDGSSQAYGFTAYMRVKDTDGSYRSNLVYARARVKPIKDAEKYTIPRMELLGVLVGARAIQFLHQEVSVMITATYLWSDSTIVLHQIADDEKIKDIWVENRLQEIRRVRDKYNVQFRHVPTADNPADIVSRGIAASELQTCSKWWFGPPFLALDAVHWPTGPATLSNGTHSVPSSTSDLDKYGSSSFSALYVQTFTPEERIPKRKLRSRKKPNPLDTITEPLPVTSATAYAVAAFGHATHSVATLHSLPSTSILPAETEQKYPQWSRQVRITYYVMRFAAAYLRRIRERLLQRREGQRKKVAFMPTFTPALGFDLADHFISSKPNLKDLSVVELTMLRKTQLRHPPSKHDRRNLGIFEHQGLLYVKGRLGNMKMRPSALTPLYLPKEAKETALLITEYHRNNCHSGVQDTLANIRMKYWFTSGRRTVQRAIYKHCFPCRREVLHPYASPPWPQLPTTRVTQARPFLCTGLDFFGPCQIRAPHPNGGYELKKCYVAIFVCMTYRCVHLELCSDLSTEQFLHALRRFGSRREYPARILSDNGASFLTARQVINHIRQTNEPSRPVKRRNPVRQAVISRISSRRNPTHSVGPSSAQNSQPPTHPTLTPEEERLIDFCQQKKIEWQTITELSPWRGGVYERLIGLIKHCLRRSIGRTKPTEVEFSSLLAEAERTANSRPLSYIADSDTDFYLVRPLDILIPLLREEAPHNPLDPPIEEDCDPNDADFVAPGENRLHAKIIQGLKKSRRASDTFWIEFRDGYLADLRSRGVNRKKNQFGEPTVQLGDLVLIKEPDVPRCDWRLALVIDLLPDQDGLIRTARVRFSRTHQEHTRALEHLYPIGNIPRVPSRCETTVIADVFSVASISEDAMAPTSTSATTTSSNTAGQEALTTTEASTAQPAASVPTHSVEEAAPAQDTTTSPTTCDQSPAAHLLALDDHTSALYRTIQSKLAAAANAPDEATRDSILAEMAKETAVLIAAGPRADPADQEAGKDDNSCSKPSDIPPVAENTTDKDDSAHSGAKPTTEMPATGAPEEDDFVQTMFPSQRTAQSIRGSTCKRIFRGGFGPNPLGLPRLPVQVQAPPQDPLQADPTHSVGASQAQNPTGNTSIRGATASRRARGRGYVMKRPTTTTRPPYDVTPDYPDTDPPTVTDQPEPTKPPTDTTPEETTDATETVETSDAQNSAIIPASNAEEAVETPDAQILPPNPTHSVGASTPSLPETSETTPPAASSSPLPPLRLFDPTTLPAYPEWEEIKRRIRQLVTEETQGGVTARKIEASMLATYPLPAAQLTTFGFNAVTHREIYRRPTNHPWDPVTVCDGLGEDIHHFHQSILVARIIIKSTWRRYTVIIESRDLQNLLDHVLSLHVRCLGQMILLVYAVRLGGNHPRTAHILYFIRDMLKTTDFEWKIPQLLNQHLKKMTEGLAPRVDPLPTTDDFRRATMYWLCYCHKAFLDFIEHLSGWPIFSTDWLQNKEVDSKFRAAIREQILTPAPWVIQELRDRAYLQYVLRRIRALETNDQTYGWVRLADVKWGPEADTFLNVSRTTHEYVLFADEEFFLSPISKLLKPEVELVHIDSDDKNIVLGCIRRRLPGPKTKHAIFWFGREYFNKGNEDYADLIAEICDFYTTQFGCVHQYVILPPYNRTHRNIWTGQALCLFLQKDLIVPHAQVVLHPYDALLWHEDQLILDQGRPLPPWRNSNQNADGAYHKYGALESRKFNLLRQHGIDLWTWYQGNHPGERPPAALEDLFPRRVNRPTTQTNPSHSDGPRPTAPIRPPATTGPSNRSSASSQQAVAAPPPTAAGPSISRPPANIANIFGEQALAALVEQVAQQATLRITAALDKKLGNIEELLRDRSDDQHSITSAEDRPQDPEPEW
ncbi:Pao retrotransposon peptidase family protein [Aphelenchoides avenae]|nr:Pao retrotransposon peptidase family protein [Aphelenchus avenae]